MSKNYFIKSNYKPNKKIETIETKKKLYWTNHRISQDFYTRHLLFKKIRKLIKKEKLKSILDIGCGPATKLMGILYPICPEVYGIDQERIILICRKKYNLNTFFSDDIENPTLSLKKKFDLIISTDVIEHLLNPDKLLNYIKKFCHKNTYIILSTPERDILRGRNCNFSQKKEHIREWNKSEFSNYIKNSGFKIFYHSIIENYRLCLNLKQPLAGIFNDLIIQISKIKRFNNFNKIRHSQVVFCKLNKNDNQGNDLIKKLFQKNILDYIRNAINFFIIKLYLFLSKLNLLFWRKRSKNI